MDSLMSRRRMLTLAALTAGTATLGIASPAAANGLTFRERTPNGWPVDPPVERVRIEGSNASVTLATGDVTVVLVHVARRFNYEIQWPLDDVRGYGDGIPVVAPYEANYASGTAIAIQPGFYPTGSSGNLYPLEVATVRDILDQCHGVVGWGGDDPAIPKEGHFQIDVLPGDPRLADLAEELRHWRQP